MTESGLSALKILALTFLKQIEVLEAQLTNNEFSGLDLQEEVHRFEAELIRSALIKTGGRQRRAARLLGMKVTTLHTKIKRYQITIDAVKGENDSTF
jgi:DNA-binding NtrC family response regulator